MTIRIAMWSGPRNISTAMMRAWENREDCVVSDEPFYAAYLHQTGLDHPMREEVLASQPQDWRQVANQMQGPAPGGAPIWYQKHMCQHTLPGMDLGWATTCRNAFLLRPPEQVLASYADKRAAVTLEDIGFRQQAEIFDHLAQATGKAPIVLGSARVLAAPRAALNALCAALDVPFSERMLAWPAGRRASDGVWAPAWYDKVERSTGFAASGRVIAFDDLPAPFQRIAEAAQPFYEQLLPYSLPV